MKKKIFEPCLLAFFVVVIVIISTTVKGEDNIGDLQKKKYDNESNKASMDEQASQLESSKTELEGIVNEFNKEMESLGQELNDLDTKIENKKNDIRATRKKLRQAKIDEKKQYNAMKERIQFLFECGNTSYLEIFLSNESLAESLNKAEYFSELYSYDREMLEKYRKTKEDIQTDSNKLNDEKKDLDSLKAQTEEKQKQVAGMIASSNQEIQKYAGQIADAEAKAAQYQAEADKAGNQIEEWRQESLKAQEESILKRESIEAAQKKKGGGSPEPSTVSPFDYTATDLDMLAALIQAEAEDQPYYGKLAVGSVVLNRIGSSYFPNTMTGVLYQPYQFTPVTVNSRFALILARKANGECYQAAQEVLNGNRVGSWLYFRVNDGSRNGTVIGDHVFY